MQLDKTQLDKVQIRQEDGEWVVWIPPTHQEHYEGGAILAPWGDTYWGTHHEACRFLAHAEAEHGPFDGPYHPYQEEEPD